MQYWRLGLDIGTNSIGWARRGLEPVDASGALLPACILDMGVRIFPDGREPAGTDKKTGLPKIGESLAVARRAARGMRRNRDRRLKRVRAFAAKLVEVGLVSPTGVSGDPKYHKGVIDLGINPYAARANAASVSVSKDELARALFHLCKRRGFLSNRKTDAADKESSERNTAMDGLAAILEQRKQTLGQYLYARQMSGQHVRFRGQEVESLNDSETAIYPRRSMYEDEFFAIRKEQGNQHLTDEQWDDLFDIYSFQRPLLPKKPGVCTFEHGRDGRARHLRASRYLPVTQTFRIVQEVNNLRCLTNTGEQPLSLQQRQQVCAALEKQKSLSFGKIRTLLKLPKTSRFNLESERRKGLDGNVTAFDMRALFEAHGSDWDVQPAAVQNDIVQEVLDATDEKALAAKSLESGWNLPDGLVLALSQKHYPSAHGHLSRQCMQKLLPLMAEGQQYWQAACEVYGDHTDYSQFATGEVLDHLPYYGEVLQGATAPVSITPNTPDEERTYGRIANPTVHVALNQLRKLVNALVARYGHPHSIHIELARELKTAGKRYQELLKVLAENTTKNANRIKLFQEVFSGTAPSRGDLLKMRLWEELAASDTEASPEHMVCMDVYTGRTISFRQLFSSEIEVEHILPFGRTYDNSTANCTVTFRDVNRRKGGDKLPYDFALSDKQVDPQAMLARAQNLPANKRWRFQPDAASIYERLLTKNMTTAERQRYDADKNGAFIDRQLVDTQYISRMAARYLVPLVGEPARVVPVNGHITGMIRARWNINALKNKGEATERSDHRHHAEDALIVALADRALIKRIADATRAQQEADADFQARLKFPERPAWATDAEIFRAASGINVSFRQNHQRQGKFYQETAYGLLKKDDPLYKEGYNAVVRRSLLALKESEVKQIRDTKVRAAIYAFLNKPEICAVSKWEDKLARLYKEGLTIGTAQKPVRVRRVRILVTNQSISSVPDAPYKGYAPDSVAFCDIWQTPDKKYRGAFVGYALAVRFAGNEDALHEATKPHPAAKKIMRLFKNDMVMLTDEDGNERLLRVAGFSATNNKIDVRTHTENGSKQNYKAIPVLIEKFSMRKVNVTVDGIIS